MSLHPCGQGDDPGKCTWQGVDVGKWFKVRRVWDMGTNWVDVATKTLPAVVPLVTAIYASTRGPLPAWTARARFRTMPDPCQMPRVNRGSSGEQRAS